MKVKVLMCNCKGLCDSFKSTDFNTLPFQVESELDVAYVSLHPQTCGQGGNELLADIMKNADSETYILSAACAPAAQDKLFRKIMRQTGFPAERFVPVDIRMTDNDGVLERIRQKVGEMIESANPAKAEVVNDPGPSCCSGFVLEDEEQKIS
ncbi:MAG: hypothetical protein HXY20_05225 [Acidobacteria bacterium]|nr:hypothetical protein [Acidobacteriota bacterium]